MVYRLLADENVDYWVVHRLEHYGHDVEHVDRAPELGKGSSDEEIAAYSIADDRLILTNDDDFLREFCSDDYCGLLFIEDETLSSATIADIVHAISEHVGQDEIEDVFYVSTNWL